MASNPKKMALLHQLSQEHEPISVPALVEKLGAGFATRSVRRWLAELIAEGIVERSGRKRASAYVLVEKERRKPDTISSCFSPNSEKVVSKVRKPTFEREPVGYDTSWLQSYIPNETYYLPSSVREKLRTAGKRTRDSEPAGTYARKIYNRLLIDLSFNSSRLEGNTYSRADTEKLLLEGTEAAGKRDAEKTMILNHKDAIRYIVSHARDLQVSKKKILTIHYLLSGGLVSTENSGKLRRDGVLIGGSTYIPLEDPQTLEQIIEKLSVLASEIEDPFEQSFFTLVHLSYIQAFIDVNKRTARLCANIPLIKDNYEPLSFNDVERDDYSSAVIAIYEFQDTRPLQDLYLFSYLRTCSQYHLTVQSLGIGGQQVHYPIERNALVRNIILDRIVGEEMKEFILNNIPSTVDEQDRKSFVEETLRYLEQMDENRLAGLGVTPQELQAWENAK